MARRPGGGRILHPDEKALWQQLTRSVRALRKDPPARPVTIAPEPEATAPLLPAPRIKGRVPPLRLPPAPPPAPRREPVAILDSGWEKRIRSGNLQPERSVDLHGHNLAMAHSALDSALGSALRDGVRVLLVVTGKPRPGRIAPEGRGAIRAEIGDWLDRSAHADRIASVRVAHPRHGGDGALYIILRRER
ncbi:MAG TPA: Smr/MutS family protein [Sphingobium sp.]|uniref:Smr/MutS family protein n=1 Tax=Sphingobium sp. TaxID=1912891 RepID=UPI002ED04947